MPEMNSEFSSGIRELAGGDESGTMNEGSLYRLLREGITRLLNEPGEKLFQILYRLDVAESKVHAVLRDLKQDQWPDELAKLILEREKERQKWRAKYKSDGNSDPSVENQPE